MRKDQLAIIASMVRVEKKTPQKKMGERSAAKKG
jgi:hypothetical protein